jgi:hypothetical protein
MRAMVWNIYPFIKVINILHYQKRAMEILREGYVHIEI